jgi:hypothetical protein
MAGSVIKPAKTHLFSNRTMKIKLPNHTYEEDMQSKDFLCILGCKNIVKHAFEYNIWHYLHKSGIGMHFGNFQDGKSQHHCIHHAQSTVLQL